MAWVSEVNNSSFIVIDDWGPKNTQYSDCYAKATLSIKTSGDTIDYKITMYTEVDGKHNDKPGVSLYLEIDGQKLLSKYWVYNSSSDGWNGFPTKNGSTYSGSITTKTKNDASIPVIFKIGTTQNVTTNESVGTTKTKNITRTWYTAGSAPSISIKDNKNNTITVSGALGKNGENNELKSAILYYTTDGSNPSDSSTRQSITLTATSGAVYSKAISVTKKCTIKVSVKCTFEHSTAQASSSVSVTYYATPKAPGIPVISYTKNRLTTRENWTYTWTAATAGNTDSPIKGYRIRLYKNGAAVTGLAGGSNNMITKGTGTSDHVDRESTSCTITFNPVDFGFKAKDTVKLGIYAYTKNGVGGLVFNGSGSAESQVNSAVSTIQNAGVIYTKVNNAWKEGQVWVKAEGKWHEAETVNVKTNGAWHESQ
jgi:hypothetical protein